MSSHHALSACTVPSALNRLELGLVWHSHALIVFTLLCSFQYCWFLFCCYDVTYVFLMEIH